MTGKNIKKPLRVDSHQHFWNYTSHEYSWIDESMEVLRRDFLPQELAGILLKHKMDGSIAVQARGSLVENDFLLKLSEDHQSILGIVGWLDFFSDSFMHDLKRFNSYQKMKGYRAMVQDEPQPSKFLEDEIFNKGITLIQKCGKVYELLIRENDLPAALSFCKRHDHGPIVLCHMGKPMVKSHIFGFWEDNLKKLASLSHVYVKISGIVTEANWGKWTTQELLPYFEKTINFFGPQRVLFGSDWPVCLLSGTFDEVYSLANEGAKILSKSEMDLFFGENAKRIYDL
ncbi:MAG: amidohydrolase family protein [Deltaproteobacteria bacterium]|jgi:L-fuconolactonase|nr:amidohydrolase family protein [Deltaproteobacteria bacterium]